MKPGECVVCGLDISCPVEKNDPPPRCFKCECARLDDEPNRFAYLRKAPTIVPKRV